MTTFGTDLALQVSAACAAGAAEAAAALGRCFGGSFQLAPAAAQTLPAETPNADWDGPGLVLLFQLGDVAAAALLPESSGLLPAWYANPDASGAARLMTLAQEWGMLLLPEDRLPEDFRALAVANLAAALEQGGVASACSIPLQVTNGQVSADLALVWPLPQAGAIVPIEEPAGQTGAEFTDDDLPLARRPSTADTPHELADALAAMPPYIRSLLKIKVELSVKLAETRLAVKRVLDLSPGSIIPFDKSCEESLSLMVGGTEIAVGEAVKSGDKFGLRIGSMVLPAERFFKLSTDPQNRRAS